MTGKNKLLKQNIGDYCFPSQKKFLKQNTKNTNSKREHGNDVLTIFELRTYIHEKTQ